MNEWAVELGAGCVKRNSFHFIVCVLMTIFLLVFPKCCSWVAKHTFGALFYVVVFLLASNFHYKFVTANICWNSNELHFWCNVFFPLKFFCFDHCIYTEMFITFDDCWIIHLLKSTLKSRQHTHQYTFG